MKLIQTLSEQIGDELSGARWYINLALETKTEHPTLAKTLYTISTQEMEHVKMLHDEVSDLIKEYRDEHGEPPSAMMAVYEYLHKKHIEKAADVKNLQTMFKE